MARRNNRTTKISKTSKHVVNNGNPECSIRSQNTVETTIMPKETCHCFHRRISVAMQKNKGSKFLIIKLERGISSLFLIFPYKTQRRNMKTTQEICNKTGKIANVESDSQSKKVTKTSSFNQSNDASKSLVYSYHRSFSGFAARLNNDEARKLAEMDEVVSVFPSEKYQLHTTRSWDFMGFFQQVPRTTLESDLIIGMLDTGIWPESKSFSDEGFGPPPSKWKGECKPNLNFTCNNKIIGARFFRSEPLSGADILSPRDTKGHGTHTSSTAGGNFVSGANLFGLAAGTSRGGVPSARIAVYKICWSDGCFSADILAAFDHAIADGVDIISISVGFFFSKNYFNDSIAIGAFHAMKNGILTSNSGGNSGPSLGSITNVSPWSLSVAASTIDRKFVTKVTLGNGESFHVSPGMLYSFMNVLYSAMFELLINYHTTCLLCFPGSLDVDKVRGKIVICDLNSDGEAALISGAVGSIMQVPALPEVAFLFPLPISLINLNAGKNVFQYLRSNSNPEAIIEKSTTIEDLSSPSVVPFSSRGPSIITLDILKPDLAAPGVDILASWSEGTPITGVVGDNRIAPFNIISGTSMSCPHATGAAVYVKSFHPTWSPAAIK
ncbi:cucumisin-like [Cucumis melo var. makuwa]|uniref:Cucumisin-like n=1 Tax=Cucumis melo var. makuwa TaxID=1194695 RepID=A0A5A7U8D4_CUCMM|nr:cucumisin-like [Cucumis melo var. makuwa]